MSNPVYLRVVLNEGDPDEIQQLVEPDERASMDRLLSAWLDEWLANPVGRFVIDSEKAMTARAFQQLPVSSVVPAPGTTTRAPTTTKGRTAPTEGRA